MGLEGKMQQLNTAIKESLPEMRSVAEENPNAQVLVRAIKFSNGAQWHVSQPTDVDQFSWTDLTADGVTDMGKALSLAAEQLDVSKDGRTRITASAGFDIRRSTQR